MNKPRFTECTSCCPGGKQCWQNNHMPFVGLLLYQYGTFIDVYLIVFKRYMKMKKFAWPDEVKAFNDLYEKKHPELVRGPKVKRAMTEREIFGAVYLDRHHGYVMRAFGLGGVFNGDPYTPKDKFKERDFFKLASKKIMQTVKYNEQEDYFNGLFSS